MSSPWYGRVFPGTKIDDAKNTENEFMTTDRGYRLSTSMGGVLTARGGNIVIVDDRPNPLTAFPGRRALIARYKAIEAASAACEQSRA